MMQNIQEKIDQLKEFITKNSKKAINTNPQKECEDELEWNASRFWAEIFAVSCSTNDNSISAYKEFKRNYEKKSGVKYDDYRLFDKFWLRRVFNQVEMSRGTSSLCYTFNNLKEFKIELTFLIEFYKKNIDEDHRKIERSVLEQAITNYESKNGISLNKEKVFHTKWLKEIEENRIQFNDIDFYYSLFIEYWNDFEYLSAYKNTKLDDSLLIVNKADIENILTQFKANYKKTPSIDKFVEDKVIELKGENYKINFYKSKTQYWSRLKDKIAGYYWELLLEDKNSKSDKERLEIWVSKCSIWNEWPDFLLYVSSSAKDKFMNVAFNSILNDKDLIGIDDEYTKVGLDSSRHLDSFIIINDKLYDESDYCLDNSDLFELLESLQRWEDKAQITYLHDQPSRRIFTFLIRCIVKYEPEVNNTNQNNRYGKIFKLIKESHERPFLLWRIIGEISANNIKTIPYMFKRQETISLSVRIIDNFIFNNELELGPSLQIWDKCLSLAFTAFTEKKNDYELISKVIFQIYRKSNKYRFSSRMSVEEKTKLKDNQKQKKGRILNLVENSELNGNRGKYLIPSIFNELIGIVKNTKIKSVNENQLLHLPIIKLDALVWLMKCSLQWKYKKQFELEKPNINLLAKNFMEEYLKSIETSEVRVYDSSTKRFENKTPLWVEKLERTSYVEWEISILFLYQEKLLNYFIDPRILFENNETSYNRKNNFSLGKLRTHFGVLLQLLSGLNKKALPYQFKKNEIDEVIVIIENKIVDFLKSYTPRIEQKEKINVFDTNYEYGLFLEKEDAIFPLLAKSIDKFNKKEEVIEILCKSENLLLLLIMLEYTKSEILKSYIQDKIKSIDIELNLKSHSWNGVELILQKIISFPVLLKQSQSIIKYFEEKILPQTKKTEYERLIYQSKLMLAYFQGSEKEINLLEVPEQKGKRPSEISNKELKTFYNALLLVKTKPIEAHMHFNNLSLKYNDYPVFALNRLVSKITNGDKTGNTDLYIDALEEWNEYEKSVDKSFIELVKPMIDINKLYVFNKLAAYESYEEKYNNLEDSDKMNPEIVESRAEILLKQNRKDELNYLKESFKKYHSYQGKTDSTICSEIAIKLENMLGGHEKGAIVKTSIDLGQTNIVSSEISSPKKDNKRRTFFEEFMACYREQKTDNIPYKIDEIFNNCAEDLNEITDYESKEIRLFFDELLFHSLQFIYSRMDISNSKLHNISYLFEQESLPHEKELQKDYYQYMNSLFLGGKTSVEKNDVAGGRVDVYFSRERFNVSAEIKRDNEDCSFDSLRSKYLGQAAEYLNTDIKLGFMLVLDLTKKPCGIKSIERSVKVEIIVKENDPVKRGIVVIVVPGMRNLPSDIKLKEN